jgi:hypothetical protein
MGHCCLAVKKKFFGKKEKKMLKVQKLCPV